MSYIDILYDGLFWVELWKFFIGLEFSKNSHKVVPSEFWV